MTSETQEVTINRLRDHRERYYVWSFLARPTP